MSIDPNRPVSLLASRYEDSGGTAIDSNTQYQPPTGGKNAPPSTYSNVDITKKTIKEPHHDQISHHWWFGGDDKGSIKQQQPDTQQYQSPSGNKQFPISSSQSIDITKASIKEPHHDQISHHWWFGGTDADQQQHQEPIQAQPRTLFAPSTKESLPQQQQLPKQQKQQQKQSLEQNKLALGAASGESMDVSHGGLKYQQKGSFDWGRNIDAANGPTRPDVSLGSYIPGGKNASSLVPNITLSPSHPKYDNVVEIARQQQDLSSSRSAITKGPDTDYKQHLKMVAERKEEPQEYLKQQQQQDIKMLQQQPSKFQSTFPKQEEFDSKQDEIRRASKIGTYHTPIHQRIQNHDIVSFQNPIFASLTRQGVSSQEQRHIWYDQLKKHSPRSPEEIKIDQQVEAQTDESNIKAQLAEASASIPQRQDRDAIGGVRDNNQDQIDQIGGPNPYDSGKSVFSFKQTSPYTPSKYGKVYDEHGKLIHDYQPLPEDRWKRVRRLQIELEDKQRKGDQHEYAQMKEFDSAYREYPNPIEVAEDQKSFFGRVSNLLVNAVNMGTAMFWSQMPGNQMPRTPPANSKSSVPLPKEARLLTPKMPKTSTQTEIAPDDTLAPNTVKTEIPPANITSSSTTTASTNDGRKLPRFRYSDSADQTFEVVDLTNPGHSVGAARTENMVHKMHDARDAITHTVDDVKSNISHLFHDAKDAITHTVHDISHKVEDVKHNVQDKYQGTTDAYQGTIGTDKVQDGINDHISNAKAAAKNAMKETKVAVNDTVDDAKRVIRQSNPDHNKTTIDKISTAVIDLKDNIKQNINDPTYQTPCPDGTYTTERSGINPNQAELDKYNEQVEMQKEKQFAKKNAKDLEKSIQSLTTQTIHALDDVNTRVAEICDQPDNELSISKNKQESLSLKQNAERLVHKYEDDIVNNEYLSPSAKGAILAAPQFVDSVNAAIDGYYQIRDKALHTTKDIVTSATTLATKDDDNNNSGDVEKQSVSKTNPSAMNPPKS